MLLPSFNSRRVNVRGGEASQKASSDEGSHCYPSPGPWTKAPCRAVTYLKQIFPYLEGIMTGTGENTRLGGKSCRILSLEWLGRGRRRGRGLCAKEKRQCLGDGDQRTCGLDEISPTRHLHFRRKAPPLSKCRVQQHQSLLHIVSDGSTRQTSCHACSRIDYLLRQVPFQPFLADVFSIEESACPPGS